MPRNELIPRRSFLKSIGAAASVCSAPAIIPASALGREQNVAPSERVGVGMIGLGRQAHLINMKQFLAMPDVQIVAICDVDSWRLENARKAIEEQYGKNARSGKYKGVATHADFEHLLARKDIDAVMISTPDHWHVPMAMAAFKAGKDVSLEKPIQRTIAEGRQLSNLAAKLKRVFRVDSEMRSQRNLHRLAELARN
ncbi:Gfo/Idh/MocA family oxidoreductase, partial [Candidatus Sumerlaeota bacterium]|nr:Gfo/Idh/MocA family oxidoreductase [Candidatus Sumerlaeota bacterium]